MATLTDKINNIKGTKTAIRQAINRKGGNISPLDPFNKYSGEIDELDLGKEPGILDGLIGLQDKLRKEVTLGWPSLVGLLDEHEDENLPYSCIFLFDDTNEEWKYEALDNWDNNNSYRKIDKAITSDGKEYEYFLSDGEEYKYFLEGFTHTWNPDEDLEGGFRWIIFLSDEVFGGLKDADMIGIAYNEQYMEDVADYMNIFSNNPSLRYIDTNMHFEEGKMAHSAFNNCSSLKVVPDIDYNKLEGFGGTFYGSGIEVIEDLNADIDFIGVSGFNGMNLLANVKYAINVKNIQLQSAGGDKLKYIKGCFNDIGDSAVFGDLKNLEIIEDSAFDDFYSSTFFNLKKLKIIRNMHINVKNENGYLSSCFSSLPELTTIDNLVLGGAREFTSIMGALPKIRKIKMTLDSGVEIKFGNSFGNYPGQEYAEDLIDFYIYSDGPLILTGLNLKTYPLLSKDSVIHLFDMLADVNEMELEGEKEITLNTLVYVGLSPEELSIATDKGWTILHEEVPVAPPQEEE